MDNTKKTPAPRCLVTGSKGMLGRAVVGRLRREGVTVAEADLPEVDLTREEPVCELMDRVAPTHVFHCAAYTDVDGAESNTDACRAANVAASEWMARACGRMDAMMQLISTDFVFRGDADRPYAPGDLPNPQGVYAQTKYEAEQVVARTLERRQIVRTAWLFGPGRRNFVVAILQRLRSGEPVRVVADQIGCPTYALDLADRLVALSRTGATGTFHLVGGGQCSWFEFARAIAELAGFDPEVVRPIKTGEWPSPAPRPAWSVLDCSETYALGIEPMPPWRQALAHYLKNHTPLT